MATDGSISFGARPAITACAAARRKPSIPGTDTEAPWLVNLRESLALEFLPTPRDTRRHRSSNPHWSEHGPEASMELVASSAWRYCAIHTLRGFPYSVLYREVDSGRAGIGRGAPSTRTWLMGAAAPACIGAEASRRRHPSG